ncbi:MAG: hypothetical protein Q7J79_09565, partial [Gemmatimonadales bacterium]|nr:hypothetical protein [Gemmatimonadales bacterium]
TVIARARQVLGTLEAGHRVTAAPESRDQLALFTPSEDPLVSELKALDVDDLTPREALACLADLQARARGSAPERGP